MTNKKSKRHSKRHNAFIVMAVVSIMASGCSSHQTPQTESDSIKALEGCENFLHKMMRKDNASVIDIIKYIRQWNKISVDADTTIGQNSTDSHIYHSVLSIYSDSIDSEIARLVNSRKRTFSDYFTLMDKMNDVHIDSVCQEHIDSYQSFFSGLDKTDLYKESSKKTVSRYEQTLRDAKQNGFRSRNDILRFVTYEDRDFRAFLTHLPTLQNVPLGNIKQFTDEVIAKIVSLTDSINPPMSKEEVAIMLTIRTNRRVILNAMSCSEDIRKGRIARSNMDDAYLMMLLQPWFSINAFSFALLTKEQREQLQRLAAESPKLISMLKETRLSNEIENLPNILINTYIFEMR